MKMMTRREDNATMTAMIAMSSDGLLSAGEQRDNSFNKNDNRLMVFRSNFLCTELHEGVLTLEMSHCLGSSLIAKYRCL